MIYPQKDKQICQQLLLLQYFQNIFHYIISFYINGQYKLCKTTLDCSQRLQLILNLFEHIFFFELFSTQQTIILLDSCYNLGIWSDFQRFQFYISIKNQNDWNIVSLFFDTSISFLRIDDWIKDKIQQMMTIQMEPLLQQIFNMHILSQNTFIINLQENEKFKELKLSFKLQFWLRQYSKHTCMGLDSVLIASKFLENKIPISQRSRIFPIYFHFYTLFYNRFNNQDQCWFICRLFKKNLNSDYFYRNFIFYRISMIPQIVSVEERIMQIKRFVKVINFQNLIFTITILFDYIHNKLPQIQQLDLQQLRKIGIYQLAEELELAAKRIDFRKKPANYGKCQYKSYIYNYFVIRFRAFFLIRQKYTGFKADVAQLQSLALNQQCYTCCKNMMLQCILLRTQQIYYYGCLNPDVELLKLLDFYVQFEYKMKEESPSSWLTSLSSIYKCYIAIICKLIDVKCFDRRLTQTIYKIYCICKQNNSIDRLFQYHSRPQLVQLIIASTLQVGGFGQMMICIKEIIRYVHYAENSIIISLIINSFHHFMENYLLIRFPEFKNQALLLLNKTESEEPYTAVFYYSYILIQNHSIERFLYIIRIFQLLRQMPLKIIQYFEALLYCFILYRDRNILLKLININLLKYQHFDCQKKKQRKIRQIEKSLLKVINCVDNSIVPCKKIQKSSIKSYNMLLKACQKMGSYKLLNYQNKKLILKPKIKQR